MGKPGAHRNGEQPLGGLSLLAALHQLRKVNRPGRPDAVHKLLQALRRDVMKRKNKPAGKLYHRLLKKADVRHERMDLSDRAVLTTRASQAVPGNPRRWFRAPAGSPDIPAPAAADAPSVPRR